MGVVTGADLPRPRLVDADFEERDGTPVVVDVDLLGERKEPGRGLPGRTDRRPNPRQVPHPRVVSP